MSSGGKGQIEIQDRDVALLCTLFECRVMTRSQAALLHFDGKSDAAKKRIQLLKGAGYLNDRPRRPHEPAVLMVTRKGYELLETNGELQRFPVFRNWKHAAKRLSVSPLTIQHELEVMDVRAAIIAAVRKQANLSISTFCTWPAMIAFETADQNGKGVEVRPDGFCRLTQHLGNGEVRDHLLYLEVDRSTESQAILLNRIYGYANFQRQGGFESRPGRIGKNERRIPFRVLMTCRSVERCNDLIRRLSLSDRKVSAVVWMTTTAEAIRDPLGAIWNTPGEYGTAAAHFKNNPGWK